MSEINNSVNNIYSKNTLKLINRNFDCIIRDIDNVTDSIRDECSKNKTAHISKEQDSEIDVVKLVLNGFDYNLARHMVGISRNMETYAVLSIISNGSDKWHKFLTDLYTGVKFFIKDLVCQSYDYAKLIKADTRDVKQLSIEVEGDNLVDRKYDFFNSYQNKTFFTLLNQLIYIKSEINSNNPDRIIELLQDFNIKKLISTLDVPFQEFET